MPPVRFLSEQEGRKLFQEACQRELGIGAEEFVRKLKAGEYDAIFDQNQKFMQVWFLLPFWGDTEVMGLRVRPEIKRRAILTEMIQDAQDMGEYARPEVAEAIEASWGQNEEGYRKLGNT